MVATAPSTNADQPEPSDSATTRYPAPSASTRTRMSSPVSCSIDTVADRPAAAGPSASRTTVSDGRVEPPSAVSRAGCVGITSDLAAHRILDRLVVRSQSTPCWSLYTNLNPSSSDPMSCTLGTAPVALNSTGAPVETIRMVWVPVVGRSSPAMGTVSHPGSSEPLVAVPVANVLPRPSSTVTSRRSADRTVASTCTRTPRIGPATMGTLSPAAVVVTRSAPWIDSAVRSGSVTGPGTARIWDPITQRAPSRSNRESWMLEPVMEMVSLGLVGVRPGGVYALGSMASMYARQASGWNVCAVAVLMS